MRAALPILFILTSHFMMAQNSILEGNLDWSKWEIDLPDTEKIQALDRLIQSVENFPPLIAKQYTAGTNYSAFHFIDLDSDSQVDIAFNGKTETGDGVVLFLKSGSVYIQSNTLGGNIVGIERSKLSGNVHFKIQQDPSGQEHYRLIVNLSIRPNDFKMLTSVEYSYKRTTEIPNTFFTPKPFTTKIEYNLRAQPKFKASPNKWLEKIESNVVATYPAGSIGKAISQKTDAAGREWWFVIMENNLWPTKSLLVYKKPINMSMGWMSSQYLVPIKP